MITVEPILLDVDVSVEEFDLEVNDETAVDFELGTAINVIHLQGDEYEGPYIVTPKVEQQELATRAKTMTDNVTVLEIPYAEVSNLSGGYTVTIGGH